MASALSLFPARVAFVDPGTGILTPEGYRALTLLFRGFTAISQAVGDDVFASSMQEQTLDALPVMAYEAPALEPLPISQMVRDAYPVGAVFISTVATDPAILLGYGTWAAFGSGRALIGFANADADFGVLGGTGGAKSITIDDHAHHTHSIGSATTAVQSGTGATVVLSVNANTGNESPTLAHTSGAVSPIATLPPFITVMFWKRTA